MNIDSNKVLKIFEDILSIPRESGKEDKISNFIIDYAKKNNCYCKKDKYNNVFIKKNNNSNRTIILQAHSDMVCVSDSKYDFDKNGIPFYIDKGYYKAKNTSLGADDGIGIAIILSLLNETNIPNLEVIITSEEETTMNGASNFDYSLLSTNILISLDGITEGDIECSSAGMCSIKLSKNISFKTSNVNNYVIKVKNLAGGHSGDDIHKNRFNLIKLLINIISKIEDIKINEINIGEKDNVIPSNGLIKISTKIGLNDIKSIVSFNNISLSNDDKNANIEVEIDELNKNYITESSEIINFINELENGVIKTFDDGFPMLSSNIGRIFIDKNIMNIFMSIRSSNKDLENKQICKLKELCNKYNFNYNLVAQKPFFPYREISNIRELLSKKYKELYQKEAIIKKVHACMEGGIFSLNIPNLDICTIAPTISNCHSIDEKVSIESIERTYIWLYETLKEYNNMF